MLEVTLRWTSNSSGGGGEGGGSSNTPRYAKVKPGKFPAEWVTWLDDGAKEGQI